MSTTTEVFDDLDDMLAGGAPSAFKKADPVGSIFEGPILNIGRKQQQRDFKSKELKTYDDGNPMWQIPVTIQTDRRDPTIPNDDGSRTLYMKGQLFGAIKQAVRAAGPHAKLRPGGHLWVQHTSTEEATDGTTTKMYAARYTPASAAEADVDSLLADVPTAVPQPVAVPPVAAVAPPVAAPVAQPPQVSKAAEIAAKLAAATAAAAAPVEDPRLAGLSDAQKGAIRNLTAEQAAGAGLEEVWTLLR